MVVVGVEDRVHFRFGFGSWIARASLGLTGQAVGVQGVDEITQGVQGMVVFSKGNLGTALLAQARGRTFEIGSGTGLNLAHYPDHLDNLVLAEPDPSMRKRLQAAMRRSEHKAQVIDAPVEQLPFANASLDTVVFHGVDQFPAGNESRTDDNAVREGVLLQVNNC